MGSGRRRSRHATSRICTKVEDRVKYLRYQMEALAPIQPKRLIGSMAHELDELGEELGSDHDLAVLAETIMEHPESCRDERERWMLIALIQSGAPDCRMQPSGRGAALYAEHPTRSSIGWRRTGRPVVAELPSPMASCRWIGRRRRGD